MSIHIYTLYWFILLPTNSQTVKELELDRLTLSNGTETTVLDTFGIKFNGVLGELETLLDKSGQFANTTTLLTKNVLSVSGTDDDSIKLKINFDYFIVEILWHLLGTGRSDTDLNTSITIFSKFTSEELVQFGVENTIGDLYMYKVESI